MSVREYIGARYVPTFANPIDWDSTKTYEPLTIVYHQGNSYTSRQYVPTGIEITNNTYWALTGNYNAQIDAYRDEVQTFNNRINSLENALPINAFNSNNTVKKNILNRKRNYILIGDSFGVGVTPSIPLQNSKGWIQWCAQYIGSSANVFWGQEPLGGVYGFASSRPFLEVLQDIEENYVNIEKELITDIVVLAGINDLNYTANVEAKISEFAAYCHSHFPNAFVRIGCIGSDSRRLRHFIKPYYEKCTKYGCGYIDCLTNLMCDTSYISSDNVHLTQDGYAFYSKWVCDAIVNGHTQYLFEKNQLDFTISNSTDFYVPNTWPTVKVAQIVTESFSSCQLRCVGGMFANSAGLGFLNPNAQPVNKVIGYIDNGLVMPVKSVFCQTGEVVRKFRVQDIELSAPIDIQSSEIPVYFYITENTNNKRTEIGVVIGAPLNSVAYGNATNIIARYDRTLIPNQDTV